MMRYKRILVHIDSRHEQHPALVRGIELAKQHNAKLSLIDFIPDLTWMERLSLGGGAQIVDNLSAEKFEKLKSLQKQVEQEGVSAKTILRSAPTSTSLIQEVVRGGYDLIIKLKRGSESRSERFFGSTAIRLLRNCPCHVLLLDPHCKRNCNRIVVAVDATSNSLEHQSLNERIIEVAKTYSDLNRCQLDIVHSWSIDCENLLQSHMKSMEFDALRTKAIEEAESKLDDLVARCGLDATKASVHLLHGFAGDTIPKFMEVTDADMVVMGTVARKGLQGFVLGNTAEQILDKLQYSVLAVKPAEFPPTYVLATD